MRRLFVACFVFVALAVPQVSLAQTVVPGELTFLVLAERTHTDAQLEALRQKMEVVKILLAIAAPEISEAITRYHFIVARANDDMGCRIIPHERRVDCSFTAVFNAADRSGIAADEIVVVANSPASYGSAWIDGGMFQFWGTRLSFAMITFGAAPVVLVHELGHSVFNFADEYCYPGECGARHVPPVVNCLPSPPNADWLNGGCHGNAAYYRPSEPSIMLAYQFPVFNRVSRQEIRRRHALFGLGGDERHSLSPPSGLQILVNGSHATLSWQPPLGLPATEYRVHVGSRPGSSDLLVQGGIRDTVVSTIAPSGIYYVRVTAVAGGEESPPSNEVRVVIQ